MGRRPRLRPLTWDELLDAHDRAEAAIRALINAPRTGQGLMRSELARIVDEIMYPALVRAGKRPRLHS